MRTRLIRLFEYPLKTFHRFVEGKSAELPTRVRGLCPNQHFSSQQPDDIIKLGSVGGKQLRALRKHESVLEKETMAPIKVPVTWFGIARV